VYFERIKDAQLNDYIRGEFSLIIEPFIPHRHHVGVHIEPNKVGQSQGCDAHEQIEGYNNPTRRGRFEL